MSAPDARPVRLRRICAAEAAETALTLAADTRAVADAGTPARLEFARTWGSRLPQPGGGETAFRWELLATCGAVDLTVARTLEPHADALAIFAEAGGNPPSADTSWGVWAAEGPGSRLTARQGPDGGWVLDGTKPWCSLAGHVGAALVTAWVRDDARGLFAVDLAGAQGSPTLRVADGAWVSRGLSGLTTGSVTFEACPAQPVGDPGWYLRRNGFGWGGVGVAAVWFGAAVSLARRFRRTAIQRVPDQVGLAHLGAVDEALVGARAVLSDAAGLIDDGHAAGAAGQLLALRARGVVADAVERVLIHVDHALGPAPLTQEEDYARRVADLRVYVRQHHGERDAAALGRALVDPAAPGEPW